MNTLEIKKYLRQIHPTIENNVYAANRLPIHIGAPSFLVSNIDPDTKAGSHWVAIHIDKNNVGQYFDSFGRAPTGYHRTFLDRNCRVWHFNTKRIQNDWTPVCGQYSLVYLFCKFHGNSMLDLVNLFEKSSTLSNDVLVCELFKCYFK